jgi:protein required for attachment to host cells
MRHWVVIADSGSCRIWETDDLLDVWALVRRLENEAVHRDAAELVSGPRGATRSGPNGVRSALDRHTDPHDAERSRFARHVARTIDEALTHDLWDRLVLVAPARFLGLVRAELSTPALRRLVASVDHDFARLPEGELPDAVRRHLAPTAGLGLAG